MPRGARHVLEVVSISDFSENVEHVNTREAVTARRGGFLQGTKVATTSGWKRIERIAVGDLVRTLDHGFKEVRRISTSSVAIPRDERRAEYLPVYIPARTAYNGRPVWLMPEQGVALDAGKVDVVADGCPVLPARMLSGLGRLKSKAPEASFDVTSLFFDEDEVIFVEGGLQAFCPSGRFSMRRTANLNRYQVADDDVASALVDSIARRGDMTALANPLGALPAPVSDNPVIPLRPMRGCRRPGRPGRPPQPTLFLKPEWMMLTHQ